VLELSQLIKDLEDKFGVSAAAATVAAAAPAGGGAPGAGFGGRGGGGRGGGRGAGAPQAGAALTETFVTIGPAMVAAAMAMQGSEMPPTAPQVKACQDRQAEFAALMAKWGALKLKLKAAGL